MSLRGEHGRISRSGCGRIDVVDRQLREEADTGKPVPLHKIVEQIAYKKGEAGESAGEPIDPALASALDETISRYRAEHADATSQYIPDEEFSRIYPDTKSVKERGLKKGRIIGFGMADNALSLMKKRDPPPPSCSSHVGPADQDLYEENRRLREGMEKMERDKLKADEEYRQLKIQMAAIASYVIQLGNPGSVPTPPPDIISQIAISQPPPSEQPPPPEQTPPSEPPSQQPPPSEPPSQQPPPSEQTPPSQQPPQ